MMDVPAWRVMWRLPAFVLALGFAGVAFTSGGAAEEKKPAQPPKSDWSVNISPYVWAAGLKGSIASFPRAPEADVDVSFSDILKNLDIAAMVYAELRYQRFAAYADIVYTSISADQNTPLGILFDDADLDNDIFIGTFGGSYRALDYDHAFLDLLVGARLWSVDTRLKLHGGALPSQEFEYNEDWVDPVIGLHGLYQFDNGIFVTALAQVGGFDVGSHLTWDAFGGLGYRFNDTISALAGYRHLEVDYEHHGFVFDVELSGPVVGATVRF
ncbi:MAG: hypothetical protein R3D05_15740 [Dongiaceae bacterium]